MSRLCRWDASFPGEPRLQRPRSASQGVWGRLPWACSLWMPVISLRALGQLWNLTLVLSPGCQGTRPEVSATRDSQGQDSAGFSPHECKDASRMAGGCSAGPVPRGHGRQWGEVSVTMA